MLWIWNDLVLIRILLYFSRRSGSGYCYFSGRSRSGSYFSDRSGSGSYPRTQQLNSWQILSYIMGMLQGFYAFWKFSKEMCTVWCVTKDKLDQFEEKLAKIKQIFLSKRSHLGPIQLFRIRPGQRVPDRTNLHFPGPSIILHVTSFCYS